MIEVHVESIRVSLMSDHRLVVLKETQGDRYLPIWIGQCEAEAIAIRLREVETPRPMTHDLLKNAITELGGEITHIVVSDLHNDTFFARIAVSVNRKSIEIDSRPSDAVALAVRAGVPIFVDEAVMNSAGIVPEEDLGEHEESEELSAFRDFVNNLDLDDLPLQ
ncbi:MAG: bifunctional nuclease family protein [Anaerolineales bacterium]|nr:bifunctional nuclease family protein [Anaerolineales bacterium]